jgi:hypothetical protein
VNLHIVGEERVARVLVEPPLEFDAGPPPFHAIAELYLHSFHVGDIYGLFRVGRDVDLDHMIFIVRNVEMQMGEEVPTPLLVFFARVKDLLHLADKAPDGQIVVKHLYSFIGME